MKQIKFWNEAGITEACKEVELARKVLKEVSKVTKKHEIPAEYILDVCNRQWDLIKEIAKGIFFKSRDEADHWGNYVGVLDDTNTEQEIKLYDRWKFVDAVNYYIYEIQDRRNLQLNIWEFK